MACIKSAPRSALAAFAPDAPYLAAGTMAGAVDLSFSSSANLEIFKLDFQSDSQDLPVAGACPSTDRFNRLSWGKSKSDSSEYSLGHIAGGLADGTISVWNPLKLIGSEGKDDAFVARLEKHTGPVRGLEFNPHDPKLLASGADEGELCIWDLENPQEPKLFPSLKSVGSGSQTEISFVSWNVKFQPILASTSYNGITVVWDLRQQKPLTSFSDSSRRRCSVLQWNPEVSTQLIIASDDDSSPSLRVWDVRKTISPITEFVGHTKGVIAMSWCPYDSSLLLTCAKDNRTICWDTNTGEIQCELPASTNWNFDVHWYLKIPGVISASSFDVKLGIFNIEACNKLVVSGDGLVAPVHLRAPKWLKRPAGVSFGFGGKLVTFQPGQTIPGASCNSEVSVHNLVTEYSLVNRSTEFEAAIQNGEKNSLRVLCEIKSQDSLSEEEKEIWAFLKVMFEEDGTARTKLLTHLGFKVNEESEVTPDEFGKELINMLFVDDNASRGTLVEGDEASLSLDNGDDFFNNLHSSENNALVEEKKSHGNQEPRETGPIADGFDPLVDEAVQRALVVGNYKEAVHICMSANRLADALVIAHAGGSSLWDSTCDKFLRSSLSPYLKIVAAMVTNDLMAFVNNRPLNLWKETLALLCTFAQKEEWTILCDTLGSRLLNVGNTLAATLCYICAGNIDKMADIWSRSFQSGQDGRSYVDLLQDLMEKTIVLALASGQKQLSTSLSKLVENYAELLASQGLLSTAMEYLKLLGSDGSSNELAILQERIALSREEREVPKSLSFEESLQQHDPTYNFGGTTSGSVNGSQTYYQDNTQLQQQQLISNAQYGDGYQQTLGLYGGYQPAQQAAQPVQQLPGYTNTVQFQSTQSPQMFIPAQTHQIPQQNFGQPSAPAQPALRPFVPANPPALRYADQYQQPPTIGSQLYPGVSNQSYQSQPSGPVPSNVAPQPGTVPAHRFPQPGTSSPAPRGSMPVNNSSFGSNPGHSLVQPSSSTHQVQQSVVVPPASLPTVQTVDTSKVSAELRPVIGTLTRLYHETSEALGGARANPAKKREIEDNSRKFGSLFAKLNSWDISPNVSSKLCQLCQALDTGDLAGALHIQVLLTTSDWDECNFWLAALKRMIKTRQTVGMYVVIYFSILCCRYQAGIITDDMLSLPKTPFMAVGLLEALGAASGMAAGAVLSGAWIPILSQTFLVWQLILSFIFLGRRYSANQVLGCILVSFGVVITVASGSGSGLSLQNVGIFWILLMIGSFFLQAADTVLKENIFMDSAKKLKGRSVDLFVVNSFGSAFQAMFICLLVPFLSKLWGIPFSGLPGYIKDGGICFLNIGKLSSGCEGAPMLPLLFVIVNMAFNISMLHLIKISSAVVSCLASTFSVPLSIYAFTLPLPFIGVASPLPAGFMMGAAVLFTGLVIYSWTLPPRPTRTQPPKSVPQG